MSYVCTGQKLWAFPNVLVRESYVSCTRRWVNAASGAVERQVYRVVEQSLMKCCSSGVSRSRGLVVGLVTTPCAVVDELLKSHINKQKALYAASLNELWELLVELNSGSGSSLSLSGGGGTISIVFQVRKHKHKRKTDRHMMHTEKVCLNFE